jgi:hypothetical protein
MPSPWTSVAGIREEFLGVRHLRASGAIHALRAKVRVILVIEQSQPTDHGSGEATVERSGRKRSDGLGFDVLVEGRVIVLESLEMAKVTGPGPSEHGADKSWEGTSDTAGRLDVFGSALRLA